MDDADAPVENGKALESLPPGTATKDGVELADGVALPPGGKEEVGTELEPLTVAGVVERFDTEVKDDATGRDVDPPEDIKGLDADVAAIED